MGACMWLSQCKNRAHIHNKVLQAKRGGIFVQYLPNQAISCSEQAIKALEPTAKAKNEQHKKSWVKHIKSLRASTTHSAAHFESINTSFQTFANSSDRDSALYPLKTSHRHSYSPCPCPGERVRRGSLQRTAHLDSPPHPLLHTVRSCSPPQSEASPHPA